MGGGEKIWKRSDPKYLFCAWAFAVRATLGTFPNASWCRTLPSLSHPKGDSTPLLRIRANWTPPQQQLFFDRCYHHNNPHSTGASTTQHNRTLPSAVASSLSLIGLSVQSISGVSRTYVHLVPLAARFHQGRLPSRRPAFDHFQPTPIQINNPQERNTRRGLLGLRTLTAPYIQPLVASPPHSRRKGNRFCLANCTPGRSPHPSSQTF